MRMLWLVVLSSQGGGSSGGSSIGGRNYDKSSNIDFAKAAKLIHELREVELDADDSLVGVECVDAQREWVVQVTKLVR